MTNNLPAGGRTGRPPLPRYLARVEVVVDLGAADDEEAHVRTAELVELLDRRLEGIVRNARIGGSRLADLGLEALEPRALKLEEV